MGLKISTRNPDIHLSQKDIVQFIKLTDQDIESLIRRGFLKPKACGGKILFRLTELIRASFYLE